MAHPPPQPPRQSERLKEARRVMATRLRELRKDAGLTGRALSDAAGWHESKVSKIEHATQTPSEDDIREWCRLTDAEGQVVDLIAAIRNIDAMYTEWRRMEQTGLRRVQESFAPVYRRTQQFRIYQQNFIPSLLQTRDYATGFLRRIVAFRDVNNDLEDAVSARIALQEILAVPGKTFAFIITETALRTPICEPTALRAQLDHLDEIAKTPNISLSIIPSGADQALYPWESFWIYDDDQVRVDTVPGQVRIKAPTDVAIYAKAFGVLTEAAVTGRTAHDLIMSARDNL